MGKFEKEAREMLEAIGGKDNIAAVTHCATRMRFVLNDDSKADVKRLEAIPAVKGTFTNAGQFQAIIGNDVPTFYNDFTAISGIEGVSKEAAKSAAQRNQNWLQCALAMMAEIFTPIIPAIIVGGLILGFIWQFIFTQGFQALGNALHMHWLLNWLTNETTGFWGLVIVTVWQMSGYIMIIYIAYLQNIPNEIIEAAKIDGASAWQRFTKITFPMIAPAFTVCMFLTLSNGFKIYDQNLSLTNGGPYNSTQMLAMDIVNTAYNSANFSLSEAKAIVFFIIVAAISLLQVAYNRKREADL